MSFADRVGAIGQFAQWLRTWPRRYGFAVLVTVIAVLARYGLSRALGQFPVFVMFFPAIIVASLLGGFGPGMVSTTLSTASVALFFWNSLLGNGKLREVVGLAIFSLIGTALSLLATLYRKHEARLREFERVVENLDEMIVVVNRDYRYLLANRAFLNYRGMQKNDVIGQYAFDILDPKIFHASIKAKLDEAFRGKTVQYELRYQYPARGQRDLLVSYFPIAGQRGIDRVASVLQDITDLKAADRSLSLFRALIDQSNESVEVIDPETLLFLDVNERACLDLGYTRDELLSISLYDVDPTLDETLRAALLHKLRTGEPVLRESMHRKKNGETFPVETSLRCVSLDREYLVAISRDITDRIRSEAALREREDTYRDLVEHSADLVCTHDLAGNLIGANLAPARCLGYSVEELLKIPMRDLIAPEHRNQFDDYLVRIRETGADKGLLCVLTRNGERRIWEYNNTLRTEGVPSPIVRGTARDVTEQKEAEARLLNSEQRYRLLFEKNLAGVAISSLDGQVLDCNDAWARMLGYDSAAEIRGRQTTEFYFDPSEREPIVHRLADVGAPLEGEMQLRRKDGTTVWVLFNSVRRSTETGDSIIQATAIDITRRKEIEEARRNAEEALRASESHFRILVDQASDGIFLADPHGRYLDVNTAGAEMLGYSRDEILRLTIADILAAEDIARIPSEVARFAAGATARSEWTFRRKDGSTFPGEVCGKQLPDGRLQGILRDISERKQAEQALRASERQLSQLAKQLEMERSRLLEAQAVAKVGSWEVELPTLEITWTEETHRIFETDPSSFRPKRPDFVERIHPEDRARADAAFESSLKNGGPSTVEYRIVFPDGRVKLLEEHWRVFRDERGQPARLVGTCQDITERNYAEQALRTSEERFRVALKDSPTTVFNQDRDLRYTWIYNPQLYWQHDVVGKTDEDVLGPKKAATLTALKHRVLQTGISVREEVALAHNGNSSAFEMSIEPLFDADGEIVGITGTCMDIARLREKADALQEAMNRLVQEKSYLETQIQTELGFKEIVGQSRLLREALKKARVVAPTDSTVLLLGETGTGKELVARSVHELSSRHDKTFVKLNCAAVPSGLLESELFGHEKGAFTSAVNQKIGRIELAHQGTLFLDEIGELPLELQPKLLRVLQDREFERLGGVRTLRVDVRIIAATNRDLHHDIAHKKFREDLFYRLNVFPIDLPPLRDRREDIPMLVHYFVQKHARRMGKAISSVPNETMAILERWHWPGNIRELENMIERMVILTKGKALAPPPAELSSPQFLSDDNLTGMEREHIIRILRETRGVLAGSDGAASRLGLKRTTLQSMLKRFGIAAGEYRRETGTFGRPE